MLLPHEDSLHKQSYKQSDGVAQWYWSFGERRVLLHYHRSGEIAPDRILSMDQIELFDI